jgi:hypothetical protein
LSFHRIERSKYPNFWSIRASSDLRVIIHKPDSDLLVCYVGHHDAAYHWAERRKIDQLPRTGAIQLIEIRERVEEVPVFVQQEVPIPKPKQALLFEQVADDALLSFGVPEEWLADVRKATEDSLFDLAEHLPQEAAEALLELATGGTPETVAKSATKGFEHPDTQRRFRLVSNEADLALALDYPWEKWTIFLHPSQKSVVERNYNGPARVSGSAGTGKTIVALHRAAFLARGNPKARILLTTFSDALADLLAIKLDRLVGKDSDVRRQVTLRSLPGLARELAGDVLVASKEEIAGWIDSAMESTPGHSFSKRMVIGEWKHLFDACQIVDLDGYLAAPRSGMKTRLGSKQREVMFEILSKVREQMIISDKVTWPMIYQSLAASHRSDFDHVIVDEAQDLSVAELRFVIALAVPGPNNLLLAGDTGQRIFQPPFSWKSLGIDIRGRSSTLRVNYRTSHQIRQGADKLLPEVIRDTDGNEESRSGTVSVFNGPIPKCQVFDTIDAEIEAVSAKLHDLLDRDFHPDEVIPLQERIEAISDEADLEEVYTSERHLLYVACTRAREELFITATNPESEFLRDGFEISNAD